MYRKALYFLIIPVLLIATVFLYHQREANPGRAPGEPLNSGAQRTSRAYVVRDDNYSFVASEVWSNPGFFQGQELLVMGYVSEVGDSHGFTLSRDVSSSESPSPIRVGFTCSTRGKLESPGIGAWIRVLGRATGAKARGGFGGGYLSITSITEVDPPTDPIIREEPED